MKKAAKLLILLCTIILTGCNDTSSRAEALKTQGGVETENFVLKQAPLDSPPKINLTDILSSTLQEFSISSGNYTWTIKKGNEKESQIACGISPLDIQAELPVLTVPGYGSMNKVSYSVSIFEGKTVTPDYVRIKIWSGDSTNAAETKAMLIAENDTMIVEIEKNMVYELTLVWEENKLERRGFSGEASYAFRTEK